MAKNEARGRPQTPKIQKKTIRKNLKIPKIVERKSLFDDPFFHRFLACEKKNEKRRKRAAKSGFDGGFGGLRTAGGDVRRGKPSGPGDIRTDLEPRQHPDGYGEFKPLREPPYPRGTPVSGLPRLGADSGNTLSEPGEPRHHK